MDTSAAESSRLSSGAILSMNSPAFTYSPGWQVDAQGADPPEPADPWQMPAGVVEFTYTGQNLALLLAQSDYWGYLYVTVDGAPANRLARIPGNRNSQGLEAGYTTLYAPDRTVPAWHLVHVADADGSATPHTVRIEVWRSWGQIPLRGVAVDPPLPQSPPLIPRLLLAGLGLMLLAGSLLGMRLARPFSALFSALWRWMPRPVWRVPTLTRAAALTLTLTGSAVLALAIWQDLWWLAWIGLGLVGLAGIAHPAWWLSALAAGLPFYYGVTVPLLPARHFGLLDAGLYFGMGVLLLHMALFPRPDSLPNPAPGSASAGRQFAPHAPWLWLLIGWSLIATLAAAYAPQAVYEWRTVFLAGGLFWLLLHTGAPATGGGWTAAHRLILAGWLVGGTLMAGLALWQYAASTMLITAEGVSRVRGLYGSPNNLALYLDRTVLVAVGLALYLPATTPHSTARMRLLLWSAAGVQLAALLLTFSKGALLLGLPAGFAMLWLGGLLLSPRDRAAPRRVWFNRPHWWLAGLALVALLVMIPFLGTERFRNLLDFSQGTGFLRLQLWRSSLAMAWDHWLAGVGPDNFLYAFRSRYLLPAAWEEPNLNHPHNVLLDGWTRLGVPGLILVVGWLANGLKPLVQRAWQTRTGSANNNKPLSALPVWIAILSASAGALAHGLLDVSYALPDLMLTWVLLFHLGWAARQD